MSSSHSPYRSLRFLTADEKEWYQDIIRDAKCSLYCTFTFRDQADHQQARRTFSDFANILSCRWRYRENIAYIMAEEMSLSGLSNFKVKRHLHCILLSNAPLSAAGIQERWGGMVGNAKVEAYDFSKNGIGYILKKRDDEHCDWALSDNIYLFAPGYEPKNKNERQSLKRHRARRSRRAGGSAIV